MDVNLPNKSHAYYDDYMRVTLRMMYGTVSIPTTPFDFFFNLFK
jgi:hypothetical protein